MFVICLYKLFNTLLRAQTNEGCNMGINAVKFSQKGFNKGFNDTLSFRPLRDAVGKLAKTTQNVYNSIPVAKEHGASSDSSNDRQSTRNNSK